MSHIRSIPKSLERLYQVVKAHPFASALVAILVFAGTFALDWAERVDSVMTLLVGESWWLTLLKSPWFPLFSLLLAILIFTFVIFKYERNQEMQAVARQAQAASVAVPLSLLDKLEAELACERTRGLRDAFDGEVRGFEEAIAQLYQSTSWPRAMLETRFSDLEHKGRLLADSIEQTYDLIPLASPLLFADETNENTVFDPGENDSFLVTSDSIIALANQLIADARTFEDNQRATIDLIKSDIGSLRSHLP